MVQACFYLFLGIIVHTGSVCFKDFVRFCKVLQGFCKVYARVLQGFARFELIISLGLNGTGH